MPVELTVLVLAALLQYVQLFLFAIPANLTLGHKKLMQPRDPQTFGKPAEEQVGVITARLLRAYNNHFEGLILFAIAVVVVTLSEKSSPVTEVCAHTYLLARLLYIPAYAQGLVPWRSLIWVVSMLATIVMLVSTLI